MVIEALPEVKTLSFLPAPVFGLERLSLYYSRCGYEICEYSVGVKLMWHHAYWYAFAEAAGCLLCRAEADGGVYFDFPVPGEHGDVGAALDELESYCKEQELPLRFSAVGREQLASLAGRYDGIRTRNRYLWRDYLYSAEEIRSFAGKKFAGQRNHIHRFEKLCPGAVFRQMTMERDRAALARFVRRFDAAYTKQGREAMAEREAAFAALRSGESRYFRIGCMEYEGEIIGVSLAERCGETLIIHIEKALAKEYSGVYPALFQAAVRAFAGDCKWVNREDDAADPGLRTSKMQYQPVRLAEKYDVEVVNLFSFLTGLPTLRTERLVLDGILPSDAPAYGRLCRDDARNRWWGYDYRRDLGDRPRDMDFVELAARDMAARLALSFAVRREGRLIGEVVLYRPDGRGGAEIGVRILPEDAGNGYGREAFRAVSDWALYSLGVTRLYARCFRENTASCRMLTAAGMRQTHGDETMLWFLRTV